MNSEGSHKVGFITVLHDMVKYVGHGFWIIVFLSFLVVLIIVQQSGIVFDPEKFPQTLIDIIPETMGFLIAGLAIIMGFNERTLEKLSKPADDYEKPIMVIIASFSVCLLILMATLIISTLYVNISFSCVGCCRLMGVFVLWGAVISIESIIHVIFHLFATGTYLAQSK